jgi:hypothetical protein
VERRCHMAVCDILQHCQTLIDIAKQGMGGCDHQDCMMLYGMVLDSAYRLKTAAESHHGHLE